MYQNDWILKRYWHAYRKINSLSTIRRLVSLDKSVDLTSRQWNAVEILFFGIKKDLSIKLKPAVTFRNLNDPKSIKRISNIIAETEMKLHRAIQIFDLHLDLITQRQSKILGRMLGGCDVFASSAIKQKHPVLKITQTPIVFIEKDYGGAVLKENVDFYGYKNLSPLIQIPYSMLAASYMLTTIPHESGHVVMPKLELDSIFPKMIFNILEETRSPIYVRDFFVFWARELFADLWAFFCCGKAQSAIRDLLALPDHVVFNLSLTDPHPTNCIRVLLSFEWCRQLWGHGKWDEWEEEWLRVYPFKLAKQNNIKKLEELRQFIPIFSRGIMKSTIPNLKVRLIDLFDMRNLSPSNLKKISADPSEFKYSLKNLNPCHQFAVFRHIYDENLVNGRQCNILVHRWLDKLNDCKTTVFDI
jgi:hypothetical protein